MPAGPDTKRVVEMACLLRTVAPDIWDKFTDAMRAYSDDLTRQVVRAAPDHLFRAQGMAITAQEIAQLLKDAPELYERNREFERNERTRTNVANSR